VSNGAIGLSAAWVEMLSYAVPQQQQQKWLHWQDQKDIIAGKWKSVCIYMCEVGEVLPEYALFVIKCCQAAFIFARVLA